MNSWNPTETVNTGGYHRIVITPPGGSPVDVTFFRDTETQLGSYSDADPFGDTTASISFPQISVFDDRTSAELAWFQEEALVDIWWVPAMPKPADWAVVGDNDDGAPWVNPLSGRADLIAPAWVYAKVGSVYKPVLPLQHRGTKVYEGFISSLELDQDSNTSSYSASCQGALFEVDTILAKPFFPPRPQTVESLIGRAFDHSLFPSLRTHRMSINWPSNWTLRAPAFTGTNTEFDPNVRPGVRWTGYTTRQTGSWDHTLTSYIQNMLAVMLVKSYSGTLPGSQWTLRLAREGHVGFPAGRTPVLEVRERTVDAIFGIWAATPGVKVNLTRDATQAENALYGTGTDLAGTTWRNAVISADGSRTDYQPLAADAAVYPVSGNPALRKSRMLRESYVQYGNGFSQVDAILSADQTRQRDSDPGWSGTVTLMVDPSPTLSRWTVSAGDTLVLRGFDGSGVRGIRFHIASTSKDVQAGTVTLTVDTRYRDALTLQDAINRMRDALTPAKLLQLNRNSVTIQDIQAPWDYSAGSGYMPKGALALYKNKPTSQTFPMHDWVRAHPPRHYPHWYMQCNANHTDSRQRWTGPWPILMAENGTIRRTEIMMVDRDGNLVPARFHCSLYYNNGINVSFMPTDGHVYSPFIPQAFQSIDPATGQAFTHPGHEADKSLIMAWGNKEQPAGYSPGLYTRGTKSTGLMVDESSWTFDCSANNPNYDHLAKAGKEPKSVISIYAMLYAEYTEAVWFAGRMFREEPGTQ